MLKKYIAAITKTKIDTPEQFRMFILYLVAIAMFTLAASALILKFVYPILYAISCIPLSICLIFMLSSVVSIMIIYETYYKENIESPKASDNEHTT